MKPFRGELPNDDTLETDHIPRPKEPETNLSKDWQEASRADLDSDEDADFDGEFTDEDEEGFDQTLDKSGRPSDITIECTDGLDDGDEEPSQKPPAPKGPSGFGC